MAVVPSRIKISYSVAQREDALLLGHHARKNLPDAVPDRLPNAFAFEGDGPVLRKELVRALEFEPAGGASLWPRTPAEPDGARSAASTSQYSCSAGSTGMRPSSGAQTASPFVLIVTSIAQVGG